MGKKKRLNRLISRWIRSDLPDEDGSPTVLLLGVTRIPTSPPPHPRRPRSLALAPNHNYNQTNNQPIPLRPITTNRNIQRPVSVVHPYTFSRPTATSTIAYTPIPERELTKLKCGGGIFGSESDCDQTPTNTNSPGSDDVLIDDYGVNDEKSPVESSSAATTTTTTEDPSREFVTNMERSVDSIGTCSLDVDASAELLSDWCENPSVDTLRSASGASIKSLTPQQEPRLPSYLSLACTVNGYSQITNYDPVRFAKSRDSSPHRPLIDNDHLNYAIQNNLLSPPNLVPLPFTDRFRHSFGASSSSTVDNMTEHTRTITHHHEEFYSKKKMFISSETTTQQRNKFNYTIDRVDSCLEKTSAFNHIENIDSVQEKTKVNGHNGHNGHNGIGINGHGQLNVNGSEPKSFIQQRVERLYGPGALAQGFFVMKRQKSRNSESDASMQCDYLNVSSDNNDKHSKSMSDKLLLDADCDGMKQSASSPSLPVLRHLTPEFRAQLPTFSPRRGVDTIQKSNTLPQLKDVDIENMYIDNNMDSKNDVLAIVQDSNGKSVVTLDCVDKQEQRINNNCLNGKNHHDVKELQLETNDDAKDGHYFLGIMENEAVRLLKMADKAEEELDAGEGKLCENAKGFLRSAAGKARLLVSQKMQQFRGLCTNNLTQSEGEAFPTTNQDLQGFWDMVMLQVTQIDSIFEELDVLRANNWKEIVKKPVDAVDSKTKRKPTSGPTTPRVRSATSEEARLKREAQRKAIIEERRKALRETKSRTTENIEIFVPESS